ncbi:aryl-alcohol oxidase-like protein [Armillaria nabsnona]|nr:aryl-alcohol oxidase-like protein [Armillaria nabsnona]
MQKCFLSPLLILSVLLNTVTGRLLRNANETLSAEYDFIIVGAGTAGCVVANRLTESPNSRVLLIEAGISDAGLAAEVPYYSPTLTPNKGPWDWNYTVMPQEALNNRTFPYPRGKVLGGSSTVNYLVFNRGGIDDFDRIANISGDQGWSWNALEPYMRKLERLTPPADGHNTTGQFIPEAHGFDGSLLTSLPGYPTPIDGLIMNATTQIAGYPFNKDMNNGDETGIGWVFGSLGGEIPERSSSATAYLRPILNRANLDVLIEHQVTRLIQTSIQGGIPELKGVEFSQGPNEPLFNLTAKNEIVLSAGSVGTPQILLLSGIGDQADLEAVGIETIAQVADVGRNLQDHPLLPNQFYVNSEETWEKASRNVSIAAQQLQQYNETGQGPLVNTICNHIGWLRVPDNSSIWENATDPSAGPTVGHYELVFTNGFVGPIQSLPDTGNFMTVISNLITPASRGTLKLNTSSPWDAPLIDPALLKEPIDLLILREAHKSARRFVSAPAFDGYISGPYGTVGASTDEDIDAYIRNFTTTVWHPVSTATMSASNDTSGVVSPELLVKNVTGVRVVDASIFPFVPSAHPEAAIYIIAERASDIIRTAWGI